MDPPSSAEGARYFDAHLHRHDPRLIQALGDDPEFNGIVAQVTNGTHPDDWESVAKLAKEFPGFVLPAYGVHPWRMEKLPDDWEEQLSARLQSGAVSVGEIGLDHWIEPRDEPLQHEVFKKQLHLASEAGLPPTIHCLKAWGLLLDCLREGPSLAQGFLVHGYGGSVETLYQLLDLGGYVSFSAYAADPKRKRMRSAIRTCPADRLLAETDAPDMVPPAGSCRYPLSDPGGGRLHHPGEIRTAYELLAELRGEQADKLAQQIEANFKRLFGAQ